MYFERERIMKKTIFTILICVIIILGITGCGNKYKNRGTDLLKDHGNVILIISTGNKSCVPVELVLYDDNQYELFTDYAACKPNQNCTMELRYTKSIKGKYDYNPIEIIEEDNIEINKSHPMDNLPEYEIYVGDTYVQKGYEYNYSVEKGTTNKSLEELLKQLDIDLKVCANPEYIK